MADAPRSWEEPTRRHRLPEDLGAALRWAREGRGWSLRDGGEVIGVSFQYLGLLEQGKRCPSVAVAKDIVRALGLQGSPDAHEVQLAARLLAVARSDAGRSFPRSL